jgi:hypothetical protein
MSSFQDCADRPPFEIPKSTEETGGDFVRFAFTLHPASVPSRDDPSGSGFPGSEPALSHHPWVGDNADEHIHPRQEERMRVRSGALRVMVEDDTDRILTEGAAMPLPRSVPHRHFNPTSGPARVHIEHRPARQSEALFSALYALAQADQADEEGLPGPLQFAVLQATYPDHAYLTDLPVAVQKAMFATLAPIGRLLGYRATPPFNGADHRS